MKKIINICILSLSLASSLTYASPYISYEASSTDAPKGHRLMNSINIGYMQDSEKALRYGGQAEYYFGSKYHKSGGSYDISRSYKNISFIDNTYNYTAKHSGQRLMAVANYQFSKKWHVIGKGGIDRQESNYKGVSKNVLGQSYTEKSLKAAAALGFQYDLPYQISLVANLHQRFQSGKVVDNMHGSIGVQYEFKNRLV